MIQPSKRPLVLLQATSPPGAPIRVSLKVALISVRVLFEKEQQQTLTNKYLLT